MNRITALRAAARRLGTLVLGPCGGLALALLAGAALSGPAAAQGSPGTVYTMTNSPDGNAIAVFNRAADGTLSLAGMVPTGGAGTGGGLGNQGAVVLSPDHRWLFAANAGSNEITSFAVNTSTTVLTAAEGPQHLTTAAKIPSGGVQPVSLTIHDNLLYVLHAGAPNNITGFTIGANGSLTPIADSTRPLTAGATGPAQVQFSPDGKLLVVTEKRPDVIDVYTVGSDGRATGPLPHPSSGSTPFGFAFPRNGQLLVSEAFPGIPNGSAVSSYSIAADGSLKLITASAPTRQTAACWIVVTSDGRYAYTTNTGSGSITGYRVGEDGALSLLNADGIAELTGDGSRPIDAALSADSRYLYALNAGTGSIMGFRVETDGRLAPVNSVGGLPPGTNGLAAR